MAKPSRGRRRVVLGDDLAAVDRRGESGAVGIVLLRSGSSGPGLWVAVPYFVARGLATADYGKRGKFLSADPGGVRRQKRKVRPLNS